MWRPPFATMPRGLTLAGVPAECLELDNVEVLLYGLPILNDLWWLELALTLSVPL